MGLHAVWNWDYRNHVSLQFMGLYSIWNLDYGITPHLKLGLWDYNPFEIGILGLQDPPPTGTLKVVPLGAGIMVATISSLSPNGKRLYRPDTLASIIPGDLHLRYALTCVFKNSQKRVLFSGWGSDLSRSEKRVSFLADFSNLFHDHFHTIE